MAYFGAANTLPVIAGFILTMGMGVDSNVLIFERIKEELAAQRGARAAVNASFSRVFLTLLDTHVASLIAAAFLFQFGTGPTSKRDRDKLRSGLSALPLTYPTDDTWRLVERWTDRAAGAGAAFGIGDLLIAAIAHEAGALVWS